MFLYTSSHFAALAFSSLFPSSPSLLSRLMFFLLKLWCSRMIIHGCWSGGVQHWAFMDAEVLVFNPADGRDVLWTWLHCDMGHKLFNDILNNVLTEDHKYTTGMGAASLFLLSCSRLANLAFSTLLSPAIRAASHLVFLYSLHLLLVLLSRLLFNASEFVSVAQGSARNVLHQRFPAK